MEFAKKWQRGLQGHGKGARYQHMVWKELECAMDSGTVAIVSADLCAPYHTISMTKNHLIFKPNAKGKCLNIRYIDLFFRWTPSEDEDGKGKATNKFCKRKVNAETW